jgi:hypothetical protein
VFKLHHSLGDGFTLMSALFSCVQRADDPSQPLSFPSFTVKKEHKSTLWNNAKKMLLTCVNSVTEFGWSFWKSTFGVDSLTPIRSGEIGVEFKPMSISIVEFDISNIKLIKSKIGGVSSNGFLLIVLFLFFFFFFEVSFLLNLIYLNGFISYLKNKIFVQLK